MEYIVIDSDEIYGELCEYIENDKPHIEEIGEDYFLTETERFEVTPDFKWVIDDITNYALNGLDETISVDMSKQPPLTQEDIQRDHTLLVAKGRIIPIVKEEDKITNNIDLELFTTYILNKDNQDKIVLIDKDNLIFETEKMKITTTKKFSKELFTRIQKLYDNVFEQTSFDDLDNPSEVIKVNNLSFSIY